MVHILFVSPFFTIDLSFVTTRSGVRCTSALSIIFTSVEPFSIDQPPFFKTVQMIQNIIKILVEQSFSTTLFGDRLLNDL